MTQQDLSQIINRIKNQWGTNVIRTANEHEDAPVLPTDLYEFNTASNLNGFPMGRIVEIFGPESCGKTTLSWQIGASLQRRTGKSILFLDYERSTTKSYLSKLGVDLDKILFVIPEKSSLEAGFEIMRELLPTGAFCLAVCDSLAAMVPSKEYAGVLEKGLGEMSTPMVKAKAMAEALRTSMDFIRESGTSVIFINHLIAKIAQPGMMQFGNPEETPGGKSLKYYSDLRIDLKIKGYLTRDLLDENNRKVQAKIGKRIELNFIKNKLADPFGKETMVLRNGKGFDVIFSAIKRAIQQGIVLKDGAGQHKLASDENVVARSADKFYDLVCTNPKVLESIQSSLTGGSGIQIDSLDRSAADKELSVKEIVGAEVESTVENITLDSIDVKQPSDEVLITI